MILPDGVLISDGDGEEAAGESEGGDRYSADPCEGEGGSKRPAEVKDAERSREAFTAAWASAADVSGVSLRGNFIADFRGEAGFVRWSEAGGEG